MHSVIDGAIVHDGIQIHREIFFFIVLGIMTFMSYRNIPITEDYDRKNEKQRDQIQRRSDIQRELSRKQGTGWMTSSPAWKCRTVQ